MSKFFTRNKVKKIILLVASGVLMSSFAFTAFAAGNVRENTSPIVADYFEKVKANNTELIAFLHEMPKGGDLHSHASATIEAEAVLEYAAEQGFDFDRKALTFVKKTPAEQSDSAIYFTNATLKSAVSANSTLGTSFREEVLSEILEAVSMRNYKQRAVSGHDHFFQYFFRTGDVTIPDPEIYRRLFTRAIKENIGYLELMTNMKTKADYDSVIKIKDDVIKSLNSTRKLDVNFIATINRNADNAAFKASLDKAIALYDNPDTHTVGITILSAEDDLLSQKNFIAQMKMLDEAYNYHLKTQGTGINFHLHAGELTLDYSEYLALTDRISKSIDLGHAKIIGHGVSIAWNEQVYELLKKMRDDKIGVTVCPSSSEAILGVSGGDTHPFKLYWNADVPVAIATDDEGLSRSNLTNEYAKIAKWFNLEYGEIKWLAFNSIEMSFLKGKGIFKDKNFNLTADEFKAAKSLAISSGSAKGIKECEVYEEYLTFEKKMESYIYDFNW